MLAKLIIARMVRVWRRFIDCMALSACLTENSITYLYGEGKSDYNYDYSYFALSLSSGYIIIWLIFILYILCISNI